MARSVHRVYPFLVAIAAVIVAGLARALLDPLVGQSVPFITFFAAVAFASWYGGLWPGVLCILLSCLVSAWLFLPSPRILGLFGRDWESMAKLITFVAVSGAIIALSAGLHRANAYAQAESRLAAKEAALCQVTLNSIGDAVIATDSEGKVTFMNPIAESLTGWKESDALNRPLSEVFQIVNEQTRERVEDPGAKVLRLGVVVELANHTWLIAHDGTERPIDDSAAPIRYEGEVHGVVLVFRDVTDRRAKERQLQESESRKAALIRAALDCIIKIDEAGRIIEFNPAAEKTFGYRRDEVMGQPMAELIIPPTLRDRHRRAMDHYLATGVGPILGKHIELTGLRSDGTEFPVELSITRTPIDGPPLFTAFLRDITERKREESALEFLANTSATLSVLVDRNSALQQAAGAMVPFFADWCDIFTVDAEGIIEHQVSVHRDPEMEGRLHEMHKRWPIDWNTPAITVRALRTGKTQLITEVPDSLIVGIARDEAQLTALRELNPQSIISVPLKVRDHTMGAMSFVAAEASRRYSRRDVRLAEDIARRVATAIDNAHLFNSLKEADRQKDEFLAMLAHELRNPLAAISYANQVARLPDVDSRVDLYDLIERQVQNLAHLIDDLLDISRISRDKIELRRELVEVSIIARRAAATARPFMEEKKHQMEIHVAEQPMPLHADPTRVEQIVTNLLTNAAKYTPQGGHVSLHAWQESGEAVIRITDSGIGISPEMLPRVFDLFTQADNTLDRTQGGLGIGLTVARKLAEMHGGTIAANSKGVGQGSEFTVRLPLSDSRGAEKDEPVSNVAEPSAPLRILVVDDNRDMARTETLLLEAHGHEVQTAYDGPSAVELAHSFHPHAILLDIGLPGMNGYEVARTLRDQGLTKETLIAVSGYGRDDDRDRSREAGFDEHFVKPVDNKAILAILRKISERVH